MMEYKGYLSRIEFDDEANIFHGEVINIRDVITFQGKSVDELRKAFEDSVEDYLAFCAERGEEPNKPFSGRFTVRLSPSNIAKSFLPLKRLEKT
jgi:predicted HicB family RNase H-like nuclease